MTAPAQSVEKPKPRAKRDALSCIGKSSRQSFAARRRRNKVRFQNSEDMRPVSANHNIQYEGATPHTRCSRTHVLLHLHLVTFPFQSITNKTVQGQPLGIGTPFASLRLCPGQAGAYQFPPPGICPGITFQLLFRPASSGANVRYHGRHAAAVLPSFQVCRGF